MFSGVLESFQLKHLVAVLGCLHEIHSGGGFVHEAAYSGYGFVQLLRRHGGYYGVGNSSCAVLNIVCLGFGLLLGVWYQQ